MLFFVELRWLRISDLLEKKWKNDGLMLWWLYIFLKPGGLDLSRRDLDRDLDLDTEKKLVSTAEKISTVSKS